MPNDENKNLENNIETPKPINHPPETGEEKPIIEIPQEYYDKIAKEKQEKEALEAQTLAKRAEEIPSNVQGLGSKIFLNAIAIPAFIIASIKINGLCLAGIPIFFIVLSAIFAFKEKKESSYPVSTLIGGMFVAVVTFVISILKEDIADTMSLFAIEGAVFGFLGLIIGGIITNLIANREEVKAVGTLGTILFFAALVAIPYFAYKKFPEQISKFLFLKQIEVKAETEEEFIVKTLKNRYGVNATCDNSRKTNSINQRSQRVTNRPCKINDLEFNVSSIAYNEGDNQYIIIDEYIEKKYISEVREKVAKEIKTVLNASKVEVYFYPKKDCMFVGDCADCDEYYDRYAEESDKDNQYKASTQLNLEKQMNTNPLDFINNYEFKYIILVNGNFSTVIDYNQTIEQIMQVLKDNKLRNTFGFNISLLHYDTKEDISTEVYRIKGNTNSSKEFKDFEVLELDGTKNNKQN
jgi:hypothetical protein